MTPNLATLLEDSARRHPTRDAVVLGPTLQRELVRR